MKLKLEAIKFYCKRVRLPFVIAKMLEDKNEKSDLSLTLDIILDSVDHELSLLEMEVAQQQIEEKPIDLDEIRKCITNLRDRLR